MAINEIPENKPGAPTDLTEKAENTPANPTDLTEVAESSPGNPNALTELSESTPGNPSDLVEVSDSNPAAPNDLTEAVENTPGNPSNLVEVSESTPGNPSDLTEVAEGSLAVPTSLTEIADSTPGNPSNLTEVAENTAGNPTSLTLTAEKFLPRTLTPRINLNFGANSYELNGVAKAIDDIVTYSRSSSATYIERFTNQFGQRDYRLANDFVGTVTNLVTYSEQFEEWTASNAVVATNKLVNPVTNTAAAEKVIDNTTNAVHTLTAASATVTSGATVNLSIRAKAGTLSRIGLFETQSADGVLFDIQSGVIVSETGTPDESSVKYLSDGWYELSVTVTVPATSAVFAIYLDSFSAYAGNNEYLYIVGAQLTESTKSLPYVKTISASASKTFSESPRLEYDPATGEALGYLCEDSATNLALHSENMNDAVWVTSASGTGVVPVITPNYSVAPDGSLTADRIVFDLNGGATINDYSRISQSISTSSGSTCSIWVKANTFGNDIAISISGGGKTHLVTGEWKRVSANKATSGLLEFRIELRGTLTTSDTADVLIWGAQVEENLFPTSYIPTTTSTASRNRDQMDLDVALIGDNLMSYSVDYRSFGNNNDFSALFRIGGLDGTVVRHYLNNTSNQQPVGQIGSDGLFSGVDVAVGVSYKEVVVKSESQLEFYRGGDLLANQPSIQNFDPDYAQTGYIGRGLSGSSQYFNGHIKRLRFYDVALTAQEVALL